MRSVIVASSVYCQFRTLSNMVDMSCYCRIGMGGTETGDWRGSCQLFISCGGSLTICNLANSSSASLHSIQYRILAVKYIFTWEVEAEDKFSSDIYYFCEAHLTQLNWVWELVGDSSWSWPINCFMCHCVKTGNQSLIKFSNYYASVHTIYAQISTVHSASGGQWTMW